MCVHATMHTRTRQNKQTDWERSSIHPTAWHRHYPHSKPDTRCFLCCDNFAPVSALWVQLLTNKGKTNNLQKSNEYSLLAHVLWCFCPLSPCYRVHLERLVELVSLELLERRLAFLNNSGFCGACALLSVTSSNDPEYHFTFRVKTEKQETLGRLASLALLWVAHISPSAFSTILYWTF